MHAPFEYSANFRRLVERLHSATDSAIPDDFAVNAQLGGPDSQLFQSRSRLVRELEIRCGSLLSRRVLDVGCGTGATTAALAEACREVVGFDAHEERLEVAEARLREHGRADHVRLLHADTIDRLPNNVGTFNVVLLNSVLEHIPLSRTGARKNLLRTAYAMLRPNGCLVITDTPNRLWPRDERATGLPLLPWTPAGSRLSLMLARRLGRRATGGAPVDAMELEASGAWGSSYWEIASALKGTGAVCLNLLPGQDQRVSYGIRANLARRRLERTLYIPAVKLLQVPITALLPSLTHLVFRKPAAMA